MLRLAVDKSRNDVAESGQRQVDLGRLLQPISRCLSLGLSLRPGQVDKVELARSDMLLAVHG